MITSWITIVLVGHLANALAFVIDKILLTKSIPNPIAYTFFISLLGLLVVVFIPFGVTIPAVGQILTSLAAGALFAVALLFFFAALRREETSRVIPFVGGTQPVVIFALSWLFLSEKLSQLQITALLLLILGTIIISANLKTFLSFSSKGFMFAILASLFFAATFTLSKYVYNNIGFINGFFWSRWGAALLVLTFLLFPTARQQIFASTDKTNKGTGLLFLTGQGLGALGAILLNFAISLASPTIVQAMQGIQYAFLFMLVIIFSQKFPQVLEEKLTTGLFLQKILAIVLIIGGLAMIGANP
ncbi:DMT family transporter [Candidatus Daviesbacteria bacterium]|nr:DMT family transporter [Candidatus Daviesbacteria bacterium]